jgi:hypothetical protein
MMQRLGTSFFSKVQNTYKELKEIEKRAKSIDIYEAKSAIDGIYIRSVAAVNL